MTNKIQFIIEITEQYQIKCSFIDTEKKETIIKLHNQNQEYYPIFISFQNC